MKKPTALIILDGLGYRTEQKYNAVLQAATPTLDYLKTHYPHTLIKASGEAVGLLPKTMGNSEVGHLTIGTGRIIEQPITQLYKLIETNKLKDLPIIKTSFTNLAQTHKTLHLMGLLSDAGVHSHIKHLLALIDIAHDYHISAIAIHPFLDGRDTPPKSAAYYLGLLQDQIKEIPEAFIASICGRFYSMDRNQEWGRTQKTYQTLTQAEPIKFDSWQSALDHFYTKNITDEFIPPVQFNHEGIVKNDDGIIFFNYRPDRARQLTQAFIDPSFDKFKRSLIKLAFFTTPTQYDATLPTQAILEKKPITNTLMDILSSQNLSTFAIAETEKYAHVTYFFNAGREKMHPHETRVIIPSISTETYKDIPEMQANKITETLMQSLQTDPKDFYLANYANPDMVGHSGDLQATIKAVECVDQQVKKLYDQIVEKMDGTLYVTADHGNAELMFNEKTGQPHTAHTCSPVEFIMARKDYFDKKIELPLKGLKDIAPFILKNLLLPIPPQMIHKKY